MEQLNINQSPITKIKSAGSSPEMPPYQPAMALTLRTTDSIPRALPPAHHQIEAVETNEQEKARGRRDKNPQATAPNKKKSGAFLTRWSESALKTRTSKPLIS